MFHFLIDAEKRAGNDVAFTFPGTFLKNRKHRKRCSAMQPNLVPRVSSSSRHKKLLSSLRMAGRGGDPGNEVAMQPSLIFAHSLSRSLIKDARTSKGKMSLSRPGSEIGTRDYGSLLVGLSSCGFTALTPRFYRNVGGIAKRPRLLRSAMLPALCGGFAAFSWHHLITKPIKNQKLTCAGCASVRGTILLGFCGFIVPSLAVASMHFSRKSTLQQPAFAAFLDFFYSPYYGKSKPYVVGLGVVQAVFGYVLATWVYTEEYLKNRNNLREL